MADHRASSKPRPALWAGRRRFDRVSLPPAEYYESAVMSDAQAGANDLEFSADRLGALRFSALAAQKEVPEVEPQRSRGYDWVLFLISEEAKRSFYLQAYRAKDDTTFYAPDGRPKRRKEWLSEWKDKLVWLYPNRLTVAELELVLALFQWEGNEPRLVWWARKYPYLLWRVHGFLYERYCFSLLRQFRPALKAAEAWKPAHRAGEWAKLMPRIGALGMVGTMLVLHTEIIGAFYWHANGPLVAGAGAFVLSGLAWLIYLDVFRQNRGLLHRRWDALRWRVFPLFWRSLVWSGVYAAVLLAVWFGIESPPVLPEHVHELIPPLHGAALWMRTLLVALTGSFIGWIAEWIFGREAATAPV